jgi:hypothetical protein
MATTTGRGLGWAHQRERAADLTALVQGSPCPLCRRPMYHPQQRLDLDHSVPRALGGGAAPRRLTHTSCNRRAGALLRILLMQQRRNGFGRSRNSRRW